MSVLIRGMEMPECCDKCWALDEYGDYPRCRITEEQRGYNFRIRERRMDKCPLVEVPTPHGRLIDADEFIVDECNSCDGWCENCGCDCLNCKSEHRCDFMQDIADMPTVIEAEK